MRRPEVSSGRLFMLCWAQWDSRGRIRSLRMTGAAGQNDNLICQLALLFLFGKKFLQLYSNFYAQTKRMNFQFSVNVIQTIHYRRFEQR